VGFIVNSKKNPSSTVYVRQTSMKYRHIIIGASFLFPVSAGVASTEESNDADAYHPSLSSKLDAGVGLFMPTNKNSTGTASLSVRVQHSIDTPRLKLPGY
jgi:hypothetical protein